MSRVLLVVPAKQMPASVKRTFVGAMVRKLQFILEKERSVQDLLGKYYLLNRHGFRGSLMLNHAEFILT